MKESDIRDQKRLNKFFSLMKKDSEDMINDSANFVDAEYKSWGCGKIEYVFSIHVIERRNMELFFMLTLERKIIISIKNINMTFLKCIIHFSYYVF